MCLWQNDFNLEVLGQKIIPLENKVQNAYFLKMLSFHMLEQLPASSFISPVGRN